MHCYDYDTPDKTPCTKRDVRILLPALRQVFEEVTGTPSTLKIRFWDVTANGTRKLMAQTTEIDEHAEFEDGKTLADVLVLQAVIEPETKLTRWPIASVTLDRKEPYRMSVAVTVNGDPFTEKEIVRLTREKIVATKIKQPAAKP